MHAPLLQIFGFNTSTTRLLRNGCLFLTLILALAAFPPTAQAVTPAPDGGYPGGSTAEGQNALFGIGPGTSGWGAGAFARPNTNAAPFRENDALARTILAAARDLAHAPAPVTSDSITSEPATPEPAAVGKN